MTIQERAVQIAKMVNIRDDSTEDDESEWREEEWWKSGTQEEFEKAAKELIQHGFTDDEAEDFLRDLYSAVADEFGG